MAAEFRETNSLETIRCDEQVSKGLLIAWEPHALLKLCAKGAVGIIRAGDTTRLGNIFLVST